MKHIRTVTKQPNAAQSTTLIILLDFVLFLFQAIPAIIFQKDTSL